MEWKNKITPVNEKNGNNLKLGTVIMAKIRFTYEAPRWVKTSGFVKQLALYCDLDCKVEVTKGWLIESGTVVCTGADENVIKFKDKFELAMREYNCA